MTEIKRIFVTTQMPNRREPRGAVELAHYTAENGSINLVNQDGSARLNSDGKPIKRTISPSETEHEAAHALAKQHIPQRNRGFNRRIHYWDRGKI